MFANRNIIIASAISFVCGLVVASAYFVSERDSGSLKNPAPQSSSNTNNLPATSLTHSPTDWVELIDNMCRPNSQLNQLASKFEFPFARCQNTRGTIDSVCVADDAKRLKITLPEPYQQNLGDLLVRLESADGWYDMHYILPLKNAVYHGLPLQAIAVNIEIGDNSRNEMRGWQTPYVVVQEDFSTIKSALASNQPTPQPVYYANVPDGSDVLSGPFSTEVEAQQVSKRAGGNPELVSKQTMLLEANFNDRLKAVTLSCTTQTAN